MTPAFVIAPLHSTPTYPNTHGSNHPTPTRISFPSPACSFVPQNPLDHISARLRCPCQLKNAAPSARPALRLPFQTTYLSNSPSKAASALYQGHREVLALLSPKHTPRLALTSHCGTTPTQPPRMSPNDYQRHTASRQLPIKSMYPIRPRSKRPSKRWWTTSESWTYSLRTPECRTRSHCWICRLTR
jgi:hypothetical protein